MANGFGKDTRVKKSEHLPAEALHSWTKELNQLWGVDVSVESDIDVVLNMVRDLGSAVARPVGPLTAFMLGMAIGREHESGENHDEALSEKVAQALAIARESGTSALDTVS